MHYNFDYVPDRLHSDSTKWLHYDSDVLPMWVADMDFCSPDPVIQALQARVAQGIFGYPKMPEELPSVIVERMDQFYGWKISKEDILILPGVVDGANLAIHAFTLPGEAVLMQEPLYPYLLNGPKMTGRTLQQDRLVRMPDGSYQIDFDQFEACITPETRMFTLCNPHNPVGRVFRRQELECFAAICLRHNLVICSDEIHCDLIFSGSAHIPLASLSPEIGHSTVTLMAPSKTFNIAGLHCAFAIIQNPEMRRRFTHAAQGLVGSVNLFGITAALAAYREGQPWLNELLVYLESNRDFLYDYVNEKLPGITVFKPEGTYLAWLDCRQSAISGNPAKFFLEKARVAFNDGDTFGAGGKGFVRPNFGCPRSTLENALERMKTALLKLNEGQPG